MVRGRKHCLSSRQIQANAWDLFLLEGEESRSLAVSLGVRLQVRNRCDYANNI